MKTRRMLVPASLAFALLTCAQPLCSEISLAQTKQTAHQRPEFHWNSHAWQELSANESLRNAKLAEADRKAIVGAIAEELRPGMADLEIESEERLWNVALDTRVKRIDLNGDGVLEVVAQGMVECSPTGNCPFWIFQKAGKAYRVLLEGYGQTFTIQPNRTNGYNDVVVSMHGSATQSGLTDYRYDGTRYMRRGCYNAEWEILEGEHVQELKVPRITSFPCSNF